MRRGGASAFCGSVRAAVSERRSGRRLAALFALLYFSEGAPIGFIWWALPTLLRERGVEVESITALTSLLVLPWVFKFAWAPLVDVLRTPRFGRRAWVVSAQLLMGLALLPLVWLDPLEHFTLWSALLVAHAFFAATQDVAIDALAINLVSPGERGLTNGSMQAGMLAGRSLFGGVALVVASSVGWMWVYLALVACIWATASLLLFVREPEGAGDRRRSLSEFTSHLGGAIRRRSTWLALAFALVSAAAFEATGALAGPYLVDRGASSETVGLFFALPVVLMMTTGGLVGGKLSDRYGRGRTLFVFTLGLVVAVSSLGLAEWWSAPGGGASPPLALGLLTAVYLFVGLFTAASYALFMDLTDPQLGGTQFSAYMAATNGCEAWSGWAGGQLVARAGYAAAFVAMSGVSLLSLSLLKPLSAFARRREGRD